jgi:iron complex transport system substrate-binding protein
MKRSALAAAALLTITAASVAAAVAPPKRIASMNLSADEVLSEILPPDRLVAVTRWVDEPDTANIVGRIPAATFRIHKADMEQLVALQADLVVVSEYTDADFLKLLEKSGLRYHRMQGLASPSGVRQAILELGHVVGADDAARRVVARYDATLADLAKRLAGAPRPRVLYWSGGMTAGADTALGALIEAAGGVNVGREMGLVGIVPPGGERALVANPDVILVGTWPRAVESVKEDVLLSQTKAVSEGRIVVLPTPLLVALSQYTAEACWQLAARLHPDRVPKDHP